MGVKKMGDAGQNYTDIGKERCEEGG